MDPLDPDLFRVPDGDLAAIGNRLPRKPPRHRQGEPFLKGPIPWRWLEQAFPLPGKAIHVALLLWREAGCRRSRTVRLCLAGALPEGLNRQSARRGLRNLADAGLVSVERLAGRGLVVTLLDLPSESDPEEADGGA